MDREVEPLYVQKQNNRRWIIGVVVIIAIVLAIYLFRNSLKGTIEASRIRTAAVETGDVENTISASGEIIPAYEQIITSPIRASIRRILINPGTPVSPGQAIVDLDKSLTEIELEKFQDQLALKKNSIEQLREDITRAENELKIAELEKKQLENDLSYNRESMGASLKETELGAQIEGNNLKELSHKLKMADIVADRKGVLTWVNDNIGSAVNEGEMLAKVADLGSFRIDGSCSDVYADQVKAGLPLENTAEAQIQRISLTEVVQQAREQSVASKQAVTSRKTNYWQYRSFMADFKPQLSLNGTIPGFTNSYIQANAGRSVVADENLLNAARDNRTNVTNARGYPINYCPIRIRGSERATTRVAPTVARSIAFDAARNK
eukprot:gene33367-41178_t